MKTAKKANGRVRAEVTRLERRMTGLEDTVHWLQVVQADSLKQAEQLRRLAAAVTAKTFAVSKGDVVSGDGYVVSGPAIESLADFVGKLKSFRSVVRRRKAARR